MNRTVHIASLDHLVERIRDHLRQGHHTTLAGSPGCGITTFVAKLLQNIAGNEFRVLQFDLDGREATEFARQLAATYPDGADGREILVLDHAGQRSDSAYGRLVGHVDRHASTTHRLCLWCGALDVRTTERNVGVKLCSVPSAHVSFPGLARDELLAVYRAIALKGACRWGDALQYLMLDLCGTDLALAESATNYLHGNWTDQLYDESVWDRVQEWLRDDDTVDAYRARLRALPDESKAALALIRFGGKPRCMRPEWIGEVDDGLRRLCVDGFIVPNLLPGFYQLRNLTVRFLLDESIEPRSLFRSASNEHAAALLEDAEIMLRQILLSVFTRIGARAARQHLERMQGPGELIDRELNGSLLKWAKENCTTDGVKQLRNLLRDRRTEFRTANSVWAMTERMMRRGNSTNDRPSHIVCVDYLTLDQLGQLVLVLMKDVLPQLRDDHTRKRVRENWREDVAKVRRLRNNVAHLRNVGFQDIQDLARSLHRMRQDIIAYGGWRDLSGGSESIS